MELNIPVKVISLTWWEIGEEMILKGDDCDSLSN